jgi:hypothetical protein
MRSGDAEFIQILNIIERGRRLVIQARKEGVDTSLAEEYLNEAKYALKMSKKDTAIDYSKKAISEIVKAKREQTRDEIKSKEDLLGRTKAELRNLCTQYDLDPIGVKEELADRIWDRLQEMGVSSMEPEPEEAEPVSEESALLAGSPTEPEIEEEKEEPTKPPKWTWDPVRSAEELTPGLSYLIEEKRPDRLFLLYKHFIESGRPGLSISRTNPKILSRKYDLRESGSIWLTGKEIHGDIQTVLPILEFIMSLIEEFMESNMDGIILVDGLEYLLTNNKFNSVLRFLRQLVDNVSQTECILMVALSPDALDQTEVTLLEKDLLPLNYLE